MSSLHLSQAELNLLDKGLSFAPTPQVNSTESTLQLLQQFNLYFKSVRRTYINSVHYRTPKVKFTSTDSITALVHRPMKFLPKKAYTSHKDRDSGVGIVEQYIDHTKTQLEEKISEVFCPLKSNLSYTEHLALEKFKRMKQQITIKPADKNLGIVLMDTKDYIEQCLNILQNISVYKRVQQYPKQEIQRQVYQALSKFNTTVNSFDKRLKKYLQPEQSDHQTPKFYGLPKIHKDFVSMPPLRPIIANSNSILTPVAKFLDHVLQPLAQIYSDYLSSSTSLSVLLESVFVPDNAFLVSLDVESLYPSIPQTECLDIVYKEMQNHRYALLLDPNLIIQLLHICVNFNYFEFGSLTFQQIQGTAMGAAFSPTLANIFMSVKLRQFLSTIQKQPLLLKRYIDDVFIIWQHDRKSLLNFISKLNQFHPNLHFKFNYSAEETAFLDLTIYKGPSFQTKHMLDTKTFQKEHNLYQYLHYSSNHPQSTFKAIIVGECTRYVRNNSTEQEYQNMITLLTTRLHNRGYPRPFLAKVVNSVSYSIRPQLLAKHQRPPIRVLPPVFKCIPPPDFHLLKQIILSNFKSLNTPSPRIISLKHQTLAKDLVSAKVTLHSSQSLLINISFSEVHTHTVVGELPQPSSNYVVISKCQNSRCCTCKHLYCNKFFKSTKTERTYPIRHSFSCTSRYIIYLITCTKCKKQYVGLTTQKLNTRINHHRSNIFSKVKTYIAQHFNFQDHSIDNLRVQCIDTATTYSELKKLEHYWIANLRTQAPLGLNVTP